MAAQPLHCHIRNPVSFRVGDAKVEFNSGCKIIDCSFPNVLHPEVGEICFQNYYTAFLSIKVKFRSKDRGSQNNEEDLEGVGEQKWQRCVSGLQLMADPHCEAGSQDPISISRSQLPYDLSDVSAIRLILRQPSPVWKEFRIDDLKFYKTTRNESRALPLPAWLTKGAEERKNMRHLEGVPDVTKLSSCLQQLWGLSELASSRQTSEALGRYDVDGCYEINLLSYT